jgi:hypothetical protein
MHVYVSVVSDHSSEGSGELTKEQVRIVAWGLLHESPERAAADEY